jgi:hypothetical protein
MYRLSFSALWVCCALAWLPSSASAQLPDESTVIRNRDWQGMLTIADAARKSGDTDLAKRKYLEAWTFASFWAVYDPITANSGSRRDYGIQGMVAIRTAGGGVGLDATFEELTQILAENPPKVFSGGPKNYGLWRLNGGLVNLTQNGGAVRGSVEGEAGTTFEGSEFDGRTMRVELTVQINPRVRARSVGVLTFNGNQLTGRIDDDQGHGSLVITLSRAWRE